MCRGCGTKTIRIRGYSAIRFIDGLVEERSAPFCGVLCANLWLLDIIKHENATLIQNWSQSVSVIEPVP